MTGSIQKRGRRYRVRFDASRDVSGSRDRESKTFATKADAERYLRKRLGEKDEGTYVRVGTLTFNELADRFLKASETRCEMTTVRNYERNLAKHVRPLIGQMRIADIRPMHVQSVLDGARDQSRRTTRNRKPLSPGTLRNVLIVTRIVFGWAERFELIGSNPAKRVDLPKVVAREHPDISPQDVSVFFEAVKGTELAVIVPFALLTGARRGEIAALRWCDVNLNDGRFSIRRSFATLDGEQIVKSPKSAKARRTEALPPSLIRLLQEHRKEQAKHHYEILGIGLPTGDTLVFDRQDGSAWNVNELSRQWSRFVRSRNVPKIRLHDLRHSFASLSHFAGEDMHNISNALGHASTAFTAATYVHTFNEAKQRRAARLDNFLALSQNGDQTGTKTAKMGRKPR